MCYPFPFMLCKRRDSTLMYQLNVRQPRGIRFCHHDSCNLHHKSAYSSSNQSLCLQKHTKYTSLKESGKPDSPTGDRQNFILKTFYHLYLLILKFCNKKVKRTLYCFFSDDMPWSQCQMCQRSTLKSKSLIIFPGGSNQPYSVLF